MRISGLAVSAQPSVFAQHIRGWGSSPRLYLFILENLHSPSYRSKWATVTYTTVSSSGLYSDFSCLNTFLLSLCLWCGRPNFHVHPLAWLLSSLLGQYSILHVPAVCVAKVFVDTRFLVKVQEFCVSNYQISECDLFTCLLLFHFLSVCITLVFIYQSLLHYLLLCNNQHSIQSGLQNSALAGFCGLLGLGQTILIHMMSAGSFLWLGSLPGLEEQESITCRSSSGWGCSLVQALLCMHEPWGHSLAPNKQDIVAHACQLSPQQVKRKQL